MAREPGAAASAAAAAAGLANVAAAADGRGAGSWGLGCSCSGAAWLLPASVAAAGGWGGVTFARNISKITQEPVHIHVQFENTFASTKSTGSSGTRTVFMSHN